MGDLLWEIGQNLVDFFLIFLGNKIGCLPIFWRAIKLSFQIMYRLKKVALESTGWVPPWMETIM